MFPPSPGPGTRVSAGVLLSGAEASGRMWLGMAQKLDKTGHYKKIRSPKKRAFLTALAHTGNITEAADIAHIARSAHYQWLEADPVYAAAYKDAMEQAAQRLEAEAKRRAVEGVEEPVFYQGKQCGVIRRYSDVLLMFLLKGAMPDKYKERTSTELTGAGGKPITVSFISPSEGEDGGA